MFLLQYGYFQNSLSQWLNFKLSGITYLVGKIKFKLFFSGSIGWVRKIGVPQNGWFIMENPMNKWMIWGVTTPIFWKHPFLAIFHFSCTHDYGRKGNIGRFQRNEGLKTHGNLRVPTPPRPPPPRNKALIAGLIKGNQWLIVPSEGTLYFLGFPRVALGGFGTLRFPWFKSLQSEWS